MTDTTTEKENSSLNFLLRFFLVGFFLVVYSVYGQEKNDSTKYQTRVVAVPVVYYTPETRLAVGAGGFLSFKTNVSDTNLRPSMIRVGGAYTQENQILSYMDFDTWWKQNKFYVRGELGYYDFFYYFWGVGREERIRESFTVTFPRVRLEAYQHINSESEGNDRSMYLGWKYTFDHFNITSVTPGGRLDQKKYIGSEGGSISGMGPSMQWDSRDNVIYPTAGIRGTLSYEYFSKFIGSDFNYGLVWGFVSHFQKLGDYGILASNAYARLMHGEAPFFHLSNIGSPTKMRGYYEGFHRDKQMLGWQMEYRSPVWWRLSMVAFGGNAVVAPRVDNFLWRDVRTTAGMGLRFLADKRRNVNIRLDVGFSRETSGVYLTLGEAF